LKVGEIFLASGSFTIGDRELGKYVEHLDGTLDAIEGRVSVQGVESLGGHFACLCQGV
jgi:hypothetical protein